MRGTAWAVRNTAVPGWRMLREGSFMHVSGIGYLFGAAVTISWALLALYNWSWEHRQRRWEARWEELVSGHADLDAELNRAWDLLQR